MFPQNQRLFLSIIVFAAVIAYNAASAYGLENKITPSLAEKSISSPESSARVIIKLKSAPDNGFSVNAPNAKSILKKSESFLKSKKVLARAGNAEFFAAEIPLKALDTLASDESIEYIEEDMPVRALLSESVPLIGANSVWSRQIWEENITGGGTSVCIIDTGVDYTHPDLGGCFGAGCKIIAGYNAITDQDCSLNNSACFDDVGHGTHVSGIIAANGSLKGAAPDARLVIVKALSSSEGNTSTVEAAIDWCVSKYSEYNISAISISLGTTVYRNENFCDADLPIMGSLINNAVEKNISVVAATGNDNSLTSIVAPACIANATRAAASDKNDAFAGFSNRAPSFPDILIAPGVSINSTYTNSRYRTLDGTSMSTPHVSGAIALLSQAYRGIYGTGQTPQYFRDLLGSTGKQINDASGTRTNFSRIDVLAAYDAIISNVSGTIIAIDAPKNGSFTNSSYSAISASQTSVSSMNFSIDGNGNVSACSLCSSFISSTGNLDDGPHSITVYGSNIAGKISYATAYFTVDTVPPLVLFGDFTEPDNAFFERTWIFGNVSASDANFANATLFISNASGIVDSISETNAGALYANWTGLPEGSYFFSATAYDKAGNSGKSGTRKQTLDLNAPIISDIAVFPKVSYPGENITISYAVTDISPADSMLAVEHSNIREVFSPSNSTGAGYQLVFSNTSDATTYNITIFATDLLNHTSKAGAQFEIKPKDYVSFNFTANLSLTLRIKYNNTEIGSISANSTEEKNASFGSGNYTLEIHGGDGGFAIILEGIEFLQNTVLGMSLLNISAITPDSSKYRFTDNAYSFSPLFNYSSATVCFNYTAYERTFADLSQVSNFKCRGLCADGDWSAIPTSVNVSVKTSCSEVPSFSSFVLGEILPYCGDGNADAGETCESCPPDAGACRPVDVQSDRGGGGGGVWYGGSAAIKPKNTTKKANESFSFKAAAGNASNSSANTSIDVKSNVPNNITVAVREKEKTAENKSASEYRAPPIPTGLITQNYLDIFTRLIDYLAGNLIRLLLGL